MAIDKSYLKIIESIAIELNKVVDYKKKKSSCNPNEAMTMMLKKQEKNCQIDAPPT